MHECKKVIHKRIYEPYQRSIEYAAKCLLDYNAELTTHTIVCHTSPKSREKVRFKLVPIGCEAKKIKNSFICSIDSSFEMIFYMDGTRASKYSDYLAFDERYYIVSRDDSKRLAKEEIADLLLDAFFSRCDYLHIVYTDKRI